MANPETGYLYIPRIISPFGNGDPPDSSSSNLPLEPSEWRTIDKWGNPCPGTDPNFPPPVPKFPPPPKETDPDDLAWNWTIHSAVRDEFAEIERGLEYAYWNDVKRHSPECKELFRRRPLVFQGYTTRVYPDGYVPPPPPPEDQRENWWGWPVPEGTYSIGGPACPRAG